MKELFTKLMKYRTNKPKEQQKSLADEQEKELLQQKMAMLNAANKDYSRIL